MSAIEAAFNEYQQFTKRTAVYPQVLALPYLMLGLGDEAGEVLEATVSLLKGNSSHKRELLAAEVGDVLWYLAQVLLQLDRSLGDAWHASLGLESQFEASFAGAAMEVSIVASKMQGRYKKHIRDDGVLDNSTLLALAARLLRALTALCQSCGTNLPLVAHANRLKLEDRLKRDVIKGEGDHR